MTHIFHIFTSIQGKKKKKGGKKKGKGGFKSKAPPEPKPLSTVRQAGLLLFDSVALNLFTAAAPGYTTFLAEKEAAEKLQQRH